MISHNEIYDLIDLIGHMELPYTMAYHSATDFKDTHKFLKNIIKMPGFDNEEKLQRHESRLQAEHSGLSPEDLYALVKLEKG